MCAATLKTLDLLETSTALRDKLADNTAYFRAELRKVGLTVPEGEHPIVPVMLGDARVAGEFAARMLEKACTWSASAIPWCPGARRASARRSAPATAARISISPSPASAK